MVGSSAAWAPRDRELGFTLTEVAIVVAIIAMAAALVIPALGSTRAQLRKNAGLLASAMRAAYDEAALSGQTYRMGFAFAKSDTAPAVKIDASPELLAFDAEQNPLSRAEQSNGSGSALTDWSALAAQFGSAGDDEKDGDPKKDKAALDALAESTLDSMLGVAALGSADSPSGPGDGFKTAHEDLALDTDVKILDVWVEGMSEPVSTGVAYIYFFPHGYTMLAMVHLEDENGNVYTIKLAPLTGQPTIVDGYVEVPK